MIIPTNMASQVSLDHSLGFIKNYLSFKVFKCFGVGFIEYKYLNMVLMLCGFEMEERSIYEDDILEIIFKSEVKSSEEVFNVENSYILYIPKREVLSKKIYKTPNNKLKNQYTIPDHIFKKLAKTVRGGGIEIKISEFDSGILNSIKTEGISVEGLHIAICQAYFNKNRF